MTEPEDKFYYDQLERDEKKSKRENDELLNSLEDPLGLGEMTN